MIDVFVDGVSVGKAAFEFTQNKHHIQSLNNKKSNAIPQMYAHIPVSDTRTGSVVEVFGNEGEAAVTATQSNAVTTTTFIDVSGSSNNDGLY